MYLTFWERANICLTWFAATNYYCSGDSGMMEMQMAFAGNSDSEDEDTKVHHHHHHHHLHHPHRYHHYQHWRHHGAVMRDKRKLKKNTFSSSSRSGRVPVKKKNNALATENILLGKWQLVYCLRGMDEFDNEKANCVAIKVARKNAREEQNREWRKKREMAR